MTFLPAQRPANAVGGRLGVDYYHKRNMSQNASAMESPRPKEPKRTRQAGASDVEIRPALRQHLLRLHVDETDTILIEELGLSRGKVRIDLVVINGSLHGFEIKSDRDSLKRLAAQVDLYSQVLDRATLVVGKQFAPLATSLVPAWWGVVRVSGEPPELRFMTLRKARLNPRRNARVLAELLWASQALSLLEARGAAKGLRGKPRRVLWDRVCELYSVEEIAEAVRQRLKAKSDSEAPA